MRWRATEPPAHSHHHAERTLLNHSTLYVRHCQLDTCVFNRSSW